MKLKPLHYSMLSLAITAIGVVVAIWYYRQQQAAAASSDAGPAASPLFQTAAIPSAGASGGGGFSAGGAPAGTTSPTGMTAADLASLVSEQIKGNNATAATAATSSKESTFAALTGGLFSQIISQMPSVIPGGSNEYNLTVSSPTDNLQLYGTNISNPGGYYVPPSVTAPTIYATPQGSQIGMVPAPAPVVQQIVQQPTFIPYLPTAPMAALVNNNPSSSSE